MIVKYQCPFSFSAFVAKLCGDRNFLLLWRRNWRQCMAVYSLGALSTKCAVYFRFPIHEKSASEREDVCLKFCAIHHPALRMVIIENIQATGNDSLHHHDRGSMHRRALLYKSPPTTPLTPGGRRGRHLFYLTTENHHDPATYDPRSKSATKCTT